MVVIVREMRKIGAFGADAPGGGERFIQAHVGRMRRVAKRIQHGHADPAHRFHHILRHFFAVAEIDQLVLSGLCKCVTARNRFSVRQRVRSDH